MGITMSVLTLKFVQSGHRLQDSVKPHFYEITGRIPLQEAILLTNGGTCPWHNPRVTSPKSAVAKEIADSAVTQLGKFHKLNRGPVLVAESAKLDTSAGTIVIDFGSSAKKRGLIDGGTTVTALTKVIEDGFVQSEDKEAQQLLNVRVMCGPYTDPEVEQLGEALNTNKQVDAFSIANYCGDFKWIRNTLEKAKFPAVAYFDGDKGDYTIQEVIQILSLFALPLDPEADEPGPGPATAYVAKQKCLELFCAHPKAFERFSTVLVDLLEMSEYIPSSIAVQYGKTGGKLRGLDMIASKPSKLPYLNKMINFTPHNAWVFPMLAALKPALNITESAVTWKVPVKELFDAVANTLFLRVKKAYKDGGFTFNYVGRNEELYDVLSLMVEKTMGKMAADRKGMNKATAA
jgi:hypothetical protein